MKTNRTLKLITLTAAIFGFAATSFGQNSATANANAGARIVNPITITNNRPLYFGDIAKPNAISTVTIKAQEDLLRTSDNSNILIPTSTVSPSSAKFTITGEPSYKYSVTLPATATITSTGNPDMTIDLTMDNAASGNSIGVGGNAVLYVGGTLNLASGQGVGSYTGSFNVSVAYE